MLVKVINVIRSADRYSRRFCEVYVHVRVSLLVSHFDIQCQTVALANVRAQLVHAAAPRTPESRLSPSSGASQGAEARSSAREWQQRTE